MSFEDDVHLVMHLRMTGNLLLTDEEPKHTRVRMELDDGRKLLFVDVRRFGTGDVLLGSDALAEYFASRLGVEPLSPDFTAEALRDQARGRRQPVKAFLLNQERIAGVGNIYADEALFRARIHPLRPVGTLRRPQIEVLRDAVVETLERRDRREGRLDRRLPPRGRRAGSFQDRFLVHLREGEPCPRCGTHDPEDARRRPRDLRLPAVPARARGAQGAPPVAQAAQQVARASRPGRPRAARGSRRSSAFRPRSGGRSSGRSGRRARRGRRGPSRG